MAITLAKKPDAAPPPKATITVKAVGGTVELQKPKVTAKKKTEEELSALADLIDQIGKLQDDIVKVEQAIIAKAAKETQKKIALQEKLAPLMADLKQGLTDLHEEDNPDQAFRELGKKFMAELGKAGTSRSIKETVEIKKDGIEPVTVPGILLLKDLMGEDTFYKLAKCNLGDIDKYLNPEEKELVLDTKRTARPVTVKPRVKV